MDNQALERWEKLDAYLRNELNASERSLLESQLASDPLLREELEITRAEHTLAELNWEQSFRGKVKDWIQAVDNDQTPVFQPTAPPKAGRKPLGFALVLAGLLMVFGIGYFFVFGDKPVKAISLPNQDNTAPSGISQPPDVPEDVGAQGGTKADKQAPVQLVPCDSIKAREKFQKYYVPQISAGVSRTSLGAISYFQLRDTFNKGAFKAITQWKIQDDTSTLYAANIKDLRGRAFFHERLYEDAKTCFRELEIFYETRQMPNEKIGAQRKYLLTLQAACDTKTLRLFCQKILKSPNHPLSAEIREVYPQFKE